MLSNPNRTGWTQISIGDWSDRASYLTDVPMDIMNAFLSGRYGSVVVDFDAEGWEYFIVFNDYRTYIVDYEYRDTLDYIKAPDNDIPTLKIIKINKEELVRELIDDIESMFNEWVQWSWPDEEPEREQEIRQKLKMLKEMYDIAQTNEE